MVPMYYSKKFFSLYLLTLFFLCNALSAQEQYGLLPHVVNKDQALELIPTSSEEIENLKFRTCAKAQSEIEALIGIKAEERTFANTVQALDAVQAYVVLATAKLVVTNYLSNDPLQKESASKMQIELQDFFIDQINQNRDIYLALKSYSEQKASQEALTDEEKFYLDKTLNDFRRSGLDLSESKREQVKQLKKETMQLNIKFMDAINSDVSAIEVGLEDLQGLEEEFIQALHRTEQGKCILGVDYPTYFNVMENCSIVATRQRLWTAFNNRGVSQNCAILKELAQKRNQLAHLLGYSSYAHLDIDDQMAQSPERVESFLKDLSIQVQKKEQDEFNKIIADLPESVSLSADGKLRPWDLAYLLSSYKKKYYSVDERAVAEYFPMEKTIEGLLSIYQKFFSLTFIEQPVFGAWDPEVKCIEIKRTSDQQNLGYLFLDLFPRKNKYPHACHTNIVPAVTDSDGTMHPAVSVIIANFPKSIPGKPSLLNRSNVRTFFHEFGHAIHAMLGSTQFATLSGTKVKKDFVELPSQMLEGWLSEPEILKMISSNYTTGLPLPDDVIQSLLELQNLSSGFFAQNQIFLATFALELHKQDFNGDMDALAKRLFEQTCQHIDFAPNNHFYASFGHLAGYGSKYYAYLWSKVFASDLFAHIKQQGLLNPTIGAEYSQKVLSKGGACDPNDLLKSFLGREPNAEAFMRSLGFAN